MSHEQPVPGLVSYELPVRQNTAGTNSVPLNEDEIRGAAAEMRGLPKMPRRPKLWPRTAR